MQTFDPAAPSQNNATSQPQDGYTPDLSAFAPQEAVSQSTYQPAVSPVAETTLHPVTTSTTGVSYSTYQPSSASQHTTHTPPLLNNMQHATDNLQPKKTMKKNNTLFMILAVLVIAGGIATGWGINQLMAKAPGSFLSDEAQPAVNQGNFKVGDVFGLESDFEALDKTEGILQEGGIDGDGTHHLLRGAADQTAYLNSANMDLDKFVNLKVRVWGKTMDGEKAGWLMDTQRLEVLETNPEIPKQK